MSDFPRKKQKDRVGKFRKKKDTFKFINIMLGNQKCMGIGVFKYLEDQHSELFQRGSIKLNTLEAIKEYEKEEIGDEEEATVIHEFRDVNPNTLEEAEKFSKHIKLFSKIGAGARIMNGKIFYTLPNTWLFCATKQRNDEYWASIETPYTSCFYIKDFEVFVQRCLKNLAEKHSRDFEYRIGDCTYENNRAIVDQYESLEPSYLRKKVKYALQEEIRVIIFPKEKQLIKIIPEIIEIKVDDIINKVF